MFPLPMVDESNDSPGDLMGLSCQVLLDTGGARLVCPTSFRPDVPVEPSEEIPLHQADGTRVSLVSVPSSSAWVYDIENRRKV